MDGDQKFWLTLWLGLALALSIIVFTLCYFDYKKDTKFADLGYQEVTVLGNSMPVWQKVPESHQLTRKGTMNFTLTVE